MNNVHPMEATIQSKHHLSPVLELFDICHKSDHPLASPSDKELVPNLHLWLDAKSGADPQQSLHGVPSVRV